jgi:hypothetical protein
MRFGAACLLLASLRSTQRKRAYLQVALGNVPTETITALALKDGDLLQFAIDGVCIDPTSGYACSVAFSVLCLTTPVLVFFCSLPAVQGAAFLNKASYRKLHADTLSKILFQARVLAGVSPAVEALVVAPSAPVRHLTGGVLAVCH